jgi:hypothetical protein
MEAKKAGEAVRSKVDPSAPLTVADASARAGIALRDAERGLQWLSSEYRGQLRVTNDGDLVHVFPTGFNKPWETPDALRNAGRKLARALTGALRFAVRAWVSIVLVSYAAIFVAILVGLTLARQNDSNSRGRDGLPGGALAYAFLRIVGDALFWTFHPWSPFSVYASPVGWGAPRRRGASDGPKVPAYERVNRFFFGPAVPPPDPRETERLVLGAIRAGKGRVGLADVMRVTGLPREKVDPLMARLMLDYEGDVDVSEEGGIVYRFAELRRTAASEGAVEPGPAWTRVPALPPLTGNPAGANVAIVALNAFNMLMGLWCIENGMTLERAFHLFDKVPYHVVGTGMPIALGLVPLVGSALLFLLPVGRALFRPARARHVREEKGRMAVLREVTDRVRARAPVTEAGVAEAWERAAGEKPEGKRVDHELVSLGGVNEIVDDGTTRWRFAELETEAAAVEAEREDAPEAEAKLGRIVYATDDG